MSRHVGRTWGHAIARLPQAEVDDLDARAIRAEPRYVHQYRCHAPRMRCPGKIEFEVRYNYVTGRAGRVTDRRMRRCRAHAEAFAKKHGVELPA